MPNHLSTYLITLLQTLPTKTTPPQEWRRRKEEKNGAEGVEKRGVGRVELVPFWSYSHPELRMEIVLNYILFIPLGCLLHLCFGEKFGLRVVMAGLLLSVSIEIVQLVFRIGLFEFDDMIGNTVGCLVGAVIGKLIRKKKKKATPEAV